MVKFSVGIGAESRLLPELPQEIFVVLISAFQGNSGEAERSCHKEIFRKENAAPNQILMKAYTENILICGTEMAAAEVHITTFTFGVPFFLWVLIHCHSD